MWLQYVFLSAVLENIQKRINKAGILGLKQWFDVT